MKIYKSIIITTVASLLIGIGLFCFLPKCFYSKIGLVSSGREDGFEYVIVDKEAEISFFCQQKYLDSLMFYIYESEPNSSLDISIVDSKNRKKYHKNEVVNSDMFVLLAIKRNFALNETYKLIISNNGEMPVKIKNCVGNFSTEEIKTCIDNVETEEKIYMSFMYGIYSKKYLLFSYCLFWCGCYILIRSCELRFGKQIEKK